MPDRDLVIIERILNYCREIDTVITGYNVKMSEKTDLFFAASYMSDIAEIIAVFHLEAVTIRHGSGQSKNLRALFTEGVFTWSNSGIRDGRHFDELCKVA